MLLADYPDNTDVCTIGVFGSYLHFDDSKSFVSFDDEPLWDIYDENDEIDDETISIKYEKEQKEHVERLSLINNFEHA